MQRIVKTAVTLGLVGCAVMSTALKALKAADGSGWYGGINIGQSMADIDRERIRSGLLSGGFATTTINVAKSWQFS